MSRCLQGLQVCIGADPATTAAAVEMQKQQKPASSSDGSTSWTTIAGMAVAVVAMVVLAPKIIKWVG